MTDYDWYVFFKLHCKLAIHCVQKNLGISQAVSNILAARNMLEDWVAYKYHDVAATTLQNACDEVATKLMSYENVTLPEGELQTLAQQLIDGEVLYPI